MSNHRRNKAIYAAASLAAVAWLPTGAYAAQPAGQSVAGAIEEVLVTARRREESLQDVPIAISAFGGENLQARGVESVANMNAIAPNLSVMGGGNSGESQATFRVRGMPGVSVYIDGVDQPTTDGLLTLGVVEVDRIEVLRGPQGTLFGNGSLGGAVSYVTRAPADNFGARIQGSVGSFNRRDFQIAVDMPISDTFKTKFTAASMTKDGFVRSTVINREYGDVNDEIYRADFLWKPIDSFSARYNIETNSTDRLGPARVVWEIGQTGTVTAPGGLQINTNPQVQAYLNATQGGNFINGFTNINYNNANNTSGQSYSTQLGAFDTRVAWETRGLVIDSIRHTLDLNYEINDKFALRAISGYKELKRTTQVDFDGAAEVILLERLNNTNTRAFSQELQFLADFDSVNFVVGAFYQKQATNGRGVTWAMPEFTCDLAQFADKAQRGVTIADQLNCYNNRARALNRGGLQLNTARGSAPTALELSTLAQNSVGQQNAAFGVNPGHFQAAASNNADTGTLTNPETQAIFADVTWRATDKLTVAAGIRYSEDDNPGSISLRQHTTVRAPLYPDTDINNFWGFLETNANGQPLPARSNPSKFDALTKRLSLQYQWTPDVMTYIGYADGYQPGGSSQVGANILSVVPVPTSGVCGTGTLLFQGQCVGGYMRDIFINNPAGNDVYGQLNPLLRDEQTVDSYEIGMRADWLGGALRTNITAFFTDWQNIPVSAYHATTWWDTNGDAGGFADAQIDVDGVPGPDVYFFPSLYTVGVKKAEAKGIELETTWAPTAELRLNLNIGYLKTEYTEVGADAADRANGGKLPFAAVDAGSIFAGAPELTMNFGASYEFGLPGGAAITPRIDYTWSDEYTLQTGEVLQRIQEAYGLLNARISYDPGSNWTLALTGSNLTDEYYFNSGFFTKAEQIHFMTVGRPAEYGLTFNWRFE